jgi:hypothetical protein
MSRLFADNTDEEVKSYQGLLTGLIFFILIPIAGFFWFVWNPLGKGLAFVAVFTLLWSSVFIDGIGILGKKENVGLSALQVEIDRILES